MSGLVVGVGCQRGTSGRALERGLVQVLAEAGLARVDVTLVATGAQKRSELGIAELARALGVALRVLDEGELVRGLDERAHAVAEPAARALSRGLMVVPRRALRDPESGLGMTFAVAREEAEP
jgi:cobalamin biosynthesis protein CbiG